ncbi:hypothetical protein FOA52_001349 [Chlamydomonas sp. UWO 241]|nr:hypothetical protein FOA52_001349 [Chlamydomonas sp. UWO 241]
MTGASGSAHGACRSSGTQDQGCTGEAQVAAGVAAYGAPARVAHGAGEDSRQPGSSSVSGMRAIKTETAAAHGPAAGVVGGQEDGGRAGTHDYQTRQESGDARGNASTALPLAAPTQGHGEVVKRLDGSLAELLGDVQMPHKVLLQCSVNAQLQPGTQQVVSRPEDGGGRLAMKVMEPMLSLIKRRTLCTCTLGRDTNAALPVLTMVMVTRATGTAAASPLLSTVPRPAAAPKQAPASVPAPASAQWRAVQAPAHRGPLAGAAAAAPIDMLEGGSGDHSAPGSSGGGGTGDIPQAHTQQVCKHHTSDAADAPDANAPAKKGKSQSQGPVHVCVPQADVDRMFCSSQGRDFDLPLEVLLRCRLDGVRLQSAVAPKVTVFSRPDSGSGAETLFCLDSGPLLALIKSHSSQTWSFVGGRGHGSLPTLILDLVTSSEERAEMGIKTGDENGTGPIASAAAVHTRVDPMDTGCDDGMQMSSGAAKATQKRAACSEQLPAKAKSAFRGVSADGKNWASQQAKTNFPLTDYDQELPQLKKMTRDEVVLHVRRGSSGFSKGASKYRGVCKGKVDRSGRRRWQTRIRSVRGRDYNMGTYDAEEEATRVHNFAALSVIGKQAITNFDKDAYLGAD